MKVGSALPEEAAPPAPSFSPKTLPAPAYLLLAVSAMSYLAGWVYLDGYLDFFQAKRGWFNPSLVHLMSTAWPALVAVGCVVGLLVWAAHAVTQGRSSVVAPTLMISLVILTIGVIDESTEKFATGGSIAEDTGTGWMTWIGLALGLLLLLSRVLHSLGAWFSTGVRKQVQQVARILMVAWFACLSITAFVVSSRLGTLNAAADHAQIRSQLRVFGADQVVGLVFTDGTNSLWVEQTAPPEGGLMEMRLHGPQGLENRNHRYQARLQRQQRHP